MTNPNWHQSLSRPLKTIVVDDEALGRDLVLRLADDVSKIDIVGEFSDGASALAAVGSLHPELAFLDIKMPKLTGLEAARQLADTDITVVFVTAYEEHALEAFEVQAFDYLLKPIEVDRFHSVCERAFAKVKRRRLEKFVDQRLVGHYRFGRSKPNERLKVRDGNHLRFIDPVDVIRFEAANQYVRIHTREGSYLISSESLNSLQRKVDPELFVRIHRSSIVNVHHAVSIRVDRKGTYFIEMSDASRVRVSRNNRDRLKEMDIR